MCASKRLFALTLALSLILSSTAAFAAALIEPDQIVADDVNYKTAVATVGEITRQVTGQGYLWYPQVTGVFYEGDPATYVSSLVRRNDVVKAGDPLIQVSVQYDPVRLQELTISRDRAQETLSTGLIERREAIEARRSAVEAEPDPYARDLGRLQIRRMEVELEQFEYGLTCQIEDCQREIDELEKRRSSEIITAPVDGVVTDPLYLREGEPVYNGMQLMSLSSEAVFLFVVNDERLRYGMPVQIEVGPARARVTASGHVVAQTSLVPEMTSNMALIAPDDPAAFDGVKINNISVRANTLELRNVLVLDRKGVQIESGSYVVTILTPDGVTHRRYVAQGLTTPTAIWVLQGLSDGDAVIIE